MAKRTEQLKKLASSTLADIVTPRSVLYCDACGMPPEYCEYSPDFESHCVPWLRAEHPRILSMLHGKDKGGGDDGEGGDEAEVAPAAPWTTKERLAAFYSEYAPEKLDGIDAMLEKYAGKEDKLFAALARKYGPEPEDPYYAASGGDGEDDGVVEGMEALDVGDKRKKRRGAAAKRENKVDTRVIVQKISRNRKKAVTHVVGMNTVPGVKLKEVSKALSKRFAGSSSVKGEEIIVQGDHLEEVAGMIVSKFGVAEDAVFLDLDGKFVPFGG